jgi:Na+-translocating ferredoxin:NAD+ oxidoreductase subunit C
MNGYPLITRKAVQENKVLKNLQKQSLKGHKNGWGMFPRARIGKIAKLRDHDSFLDFTEGCEKAEKPVQTAEELSVQDIEKTGLCGLSGSGFPVYKKLGAVIASNAENKFLIINGVECDPGLLHDGWLFSHKSGELEKGIALLDKLIGFRKISIAVKSKPACMDSRYEIHIVPDRYPAGAERLLIREILGTRLSPDDIPAEKGILVLNMQTVYAISKSTAEKKSVQTRFLTVLNLMKGEAVVVHAETGASIIGTALNVFPDCAGMTVYHGSGVMSAEKTETADRITCKTNLIACGPEISYTEEQACRKCGKCSHNCPMKLNVSKMVQKAEQKDTADIAAYNPGLCMQCGTCTYYCAAGKNVMGVISSLREQVQ